MQAIKNLILFSTLLFFAGCSVHKRHYKAGCYINWNLNKSKSFVKHSDDTISSKESNTEITLEENNNYPITASNDSTLTIVSKKPETQNITFSNRQADTVKAKFKENIKKKKEKTIDPKKDSKTSILLGISAICLIILGIVFMVILAYLTTFLYFLFLLAMLSEIAAITFGIIGLTKALKTLNYLKSNPEESKKNKRRAIIGLILNTLVLLPLLLFLVYYILASMSY